MKKTRYIIFYETIKQKNVKYPFAIFNTDKHNEKGTHWWSFMDIHPPKNLFLFDGLGVDGFKFFIVNNNENIIDQLLYDFKKCNKKSYQKLNLCSMKFCVKSWQNLSWKLKEQLTDTVKNFFHLLEQFAKLKNTDCMNISIMENNAEDLTGSSCGLFQI